MTDLRRALRGGLAPPVGRVRGRPGGRSAGVRVRGKGLEDEGEGEWVGL